MKFYLLLSMFFIWGIASSMGNQIQSSSSSQVSKELINQAQSLAIIQSFLQGESTDFAQAVQAACRFGNPEILKLLLTCNTEADIKISGPSIAQSPYLGVHALVRPNQKYDNPLEVAYDYCDDHNRMAMFKRLLADPRSDIDFMLERAHTDDDTDLIKLMLFMMQGNQDHIDWDVYPSFSAENEQLYIDSIDMQKLSVHYTAAELNEYRQLLIDREGVTPEHLLKAVKGNHHYIIKRILYNATDDFFKKIKEPILDVNQLPGPSILEYIQTNAHDDVKNIVMHGRSVCKYMSESEIEEFNTFSRKASLGTQNVLIHLANRQQMPSFGLHYNAVIQQRKSLAAAIRQTKKRSQIDQINDDNPLCKKQK